MQEGFEFQRVESNPGLVRRLPWAAHPISVLNLAIVMLGCLSIAVAYTLSRIPQETIVRAFGN